MKLYPNLATASQASQHLGLSGFTAVCKAEDLLEPTCRQQNTQKLFSQLEKSAQDGFKLWEKEVNMTILLADVLM